jgi:hypothetical protein
MKSLLRSMHPIFPTASRGWLNTAPRRTTPGCVVCPVSFDSLRPTAGAKFFGRRGLSLGGQFAPLEARTSERPGRSDALANKTHRKASGL